MKTRYVVVLCTFALGGTLQAQDPTPPALPAQPAPAAPPSPSTPMAAPAPMATPMPTPAWAQGQDNGPRRGWFGIQLSCDECFVQRAPGRVAYAQRPAISWVESNSPAYNAGMHSGDTIITVDGLAITSPEGFERFANALPGQNVRVGLRRNGQEREVTVVPSARNDVSTTADFYNQRLRTAQRNGLQALRNAFRSPLGWLGMGIECEQCSVTNFGMRQRGWTFRAPPAVLTVDVDGPANRAGLRRGDTLTAIDGTDLITPEGGRAFAQVEPGQRVTLTFRRAGAERRVTLAAVARPDATPEELAAFDEYKRTRDSSDAAYRQILTAAVARSQTEMRELERQLLEMQNNRTGTVDDSRRRLMVIDSILRQLRAAERQRLAGTDMAAYSVSGMAMSGPMIAPMAPMPSTMAIRPGVVYPLRYSNRLGTVANVEARSAGAVNVSEVGDSLIVVTGPGFEVKVQKRPR